MLDTTAEPKSPKRAANEMVLIAAAVLFIPSTLGFLYLGPVGWGIGLLLGFIIALPLGILRKVLFMKRVHNSC